MEQKNWSIVRQTVGYDRYEGQRACEALAALYEVVRLYTNFFQPSMKLHRKERLGSTVKKTYDTARTPYQRVLESEQVKQESKDRLQAQYRTLNPVALLRHIEQQQASLWKLAARPKGKVMLRKLFKQSALLCEKSQDASIRLSQVCHTRLTCSSTLKGTRL